MKPVLETIWYDFPYEIGKIISKETKGKEWKIIWDRTRLPVSNRISTVVETILSVSPKFNIK